MQHNVRQVPPQECVGPWCPVVVNLQRPSSKIVGVYEAVRTVPLGPEEFSLLGMASDAGQESGERLKEFLKET